jgi:hypothetical protein
MDQGDTGSCTGHGTACGIYTTCGDKLGFVPSPDGIYRNARCVDRAAKHHSGALPKLSDDGAFIDIVMRGITAYGIRPIDAPTSDGRYSDCEPSSINDEEMLGDAEIEATTLLIGEYAITATGALRIQQMRQALAAGYAITFGAFVDMAFENWTPDLPPQGACDPNDPNGGGHCMCVIGYQTEVDGKTTFIVRNSWGATWGAGGNILVSEDFVATMEDVTVMHVTIVRKAA